MTKYEKLQDSIELSDVCYVQTDKARIPVQSIHTKEGCAIFFDEKAFSSDAERTVALAHEKGHCDSGAFYTINTPNETRGRCEKRAWKRAVMELIPFDELIDAFNACRTADGVSVHDLAEHFEVTTDFIIRAVEQYLRMGKQIL